MDWTLTHGERTLLLETARSAIESRLTGSDRRAPESAPAPGAASAPPPAATPPSTSAPAHSPTLAAHLGAFVTLEIRGKLRGCIGYIASSKPLIETVAEAAEASAFHDTRFPPLRREELETVTIEISVLSPLNRIDSVEEIRVGEHGVLVRRGFQSGLLLPQVATEYGWNRKTFLENACRKAGLPCGCWRDSETRIEVFSAFVFNDRRSSE